MEQNTIQAADWSHLDLQKVAAYLTAHGIDTTDQPQPDTKSDLRNVGALDGSDEEPWVTLYGVLAFGRAPQSYAQTANFWIEGVSYYGADRDSEVLQIAEGKGTVDEQVRRMMEWFVGLGRFEKYGEALREERYLLPLNAIREALVNAVIHRDYALTGAKTLLEVFSDHVDVTSPGSLPNRVSVEQVQFGARIRARNPQLAHFMQVSRLMARRGGGWPLMRDAMREFNQTEPELLHDAEDRIVRVRFWLDGHGAG